MFSNEEFCDNIFLVYTVLKEYNEFLSQEDYIMLSRLKILLVAVFVIAFLSACGKAEVTKENVITIQGDYPYFQSWDELTGKASYILSAEILSCKTEWIVKGNKIIVQNGQSTKVPMDPRIYTVYELKVKNLFKADAPIESVKLLILGGQIENDIYDVPDTKTVRNMLKEGKEYLFFCGKSSDIEGSLYLINPIQGCCSIENEIIQGMTPEKTPITWEMLEQLR